MPLRMIAMTRPARSSGEPSSFDKFFQSLRKGTVAGFRSELDAWMVEETENDIRS